MERVCKLCKRTKELTCENFHKDSTKLQGFRYSCKACVNKRAAKKYKKGSKKWGGGSKPIRLKDDIVGYAKASIRSYTTADRKKGRECSLSLDFMLNALQTPCVYCSFPSTGVDRLDNSIGHIEANCVPCCKQCNIARSNYFTHEEMKVLGQTIKQIKQGR